MKFLSDIEVEQGADTTFVDNAKALFGNGNDMQIYHDGSNSYVRDVGTGRLWIDSNGEGVSIISDGSGSTAMAHFYKDAAVELYYNNVKRIETTSVGATLTGDLTVSGGDITLGGTGRIQGIDTVPDTTDAANKAYVDAVDVGVITVVASTVDGKEGIEVGTASGTATVGLDLDNMDLSLDNPSRVAAVQATTGKNVKVPPYILHAYNTWLGGIDGDGSTTVFTVTHDLGEKVIIQIADTASGSATEGQNVYPKVERAGNVVTVTFPSAPNASALYDVLITKIVQRPE